MFRSPNPKNMYDSKISLSRRPPPPGIAVMSRSPSVSLLSAYIHSSSVSKCKLSIPPPRLRVLVKRVEPVQVVIGAYLGFTRTQATFPIPFSLTLAQGKNGGDSVVWTHTPVKKRGLTVQNAGGDAAVPLHRAPSVGEHQVGDGGLQPVS